MERQGQVQAEQKHSSSLYTVLATSALVFLSACGKGAVGSNPPPDNNNPVPSVSGLSPDHVTAGGSGFTLTVNGSNFISSSVVNWNSSPRPTNFVNSGQLTASISGSDVATVGQAQVSVFNPAPAGGTSGSLAFSVNGLSPSISGLSPPSRAAGGSDFTLTVNGANFNSDTKVKWNGDGRPTAFVNANQVTASIPATDTAAAGLANVTTFNAGTGGGESGVTVFPVFLNLSTADLIYDATVGANNWIYASVPANAPSGANTITVIDPATGKVLDTPAPIGIPDNPDPGRLALSDDGQFLYFGLNNAPSVRRLSLSGTPALDPLAISLGGANLRAETLVVLQSSFGNTIGVARKFSNPAPGTPRNAGVAIFDADTGIRTDTTVGGNSPNVIILCAGPERLFGLNVGDGPPPAPGFYLLGVDGSGVGEIGRNEVLSGNDISLGLIAGVEQIFSTSGQVLDVGSLTIVTTLSAAGPVKADGRGNRVFYLVQNPAPANTTWTIRAFKIDSYAPIGTLDIPGVNGTPSSLIRWGTDGLAFRTDNNQVFVIRSSLVPGP